MPENVVQIELGQRLVEAVAGFARADIPKLTEISRDLFHHVSDPDLRGTLAEVFYGARWIYKLGLTLLTEDVERSAHVRAQIIDYGAITEALLSDVLAHAIDRGQTKGTGWQFDDPDHKKKPINWAASDVARLMKKRSYWWLIRTAHDFAVLGAPLANNLDWLRQKRNDVHLRSLATTRRMYLDQSKRAFQCVIMTAEATAQWKGRHR